MKYLSLLCCLFVSLSHAGQVFIEFNQTRGELESAWAGKILSENDSHMVINDIANGYNWLYRFQFNGDAITRLTAHVQWPNTSEDGRGELLKLFDQTFGERLSNDHQEYIWMDSEQGILVTTEQVANKPNEMLIQFEKASSAGVQIQ